MIVYVDVDDTLVRWAGTKMIPIPRAIERVIELHKSNNNLYLWSTGGPKHARMVANRLCIEYCFDQFLPKPDLIIDDQPIHDWRGLKHEYPIGEAIDNKES